MDIKTKGFKPRYTHITVEADTGKLLLWYNVSTIPKDVLLVKASTYGELNDGAIKVFGKDAWIDYVFDKFSNDLTNEHFTFLAANLYGRGLKNGLLNAMEQFKKNVTEATDYSKKSVNEGAKSVAKINSDAQPAKNETVKAEPPKEPQTIKEGPEAQPYEYVDGPAHYDGTKCMEEMIALYGDIAVRNFCICNAYKYRYRAGRKPGVDAQQDLAKARWYEDYAINELV